jgi:predicted phage terminase large subunit-like protein
LGSRRGDYSAFVALGLAADGTLYIEADLARRPTPQIVTDGVELVRRFRPQLFGIEANQFQDLLGADFLAEFTRQGLIGTAPCSITNTINKQVRIRRLGPLLAARRLRFKTNSPGTRLLVQQLREFPIAGHDDGPDALEMALRLIESLTQATPNDGLGNRLI